MSEGTESWTEVDEVADQRVDVEDLPLVVDRERFDRIGVLGTGGMGEVRLYRDRRISRFVAHKVLKQSVAKDPHFRSRFLLEARVQGQLEHPAIVPVYDLGETPDGELYFAMKSVRGVTLRQALDTIKRGTQNPQYSLRRLLTAFSSVCLAVDFAHARGVVHRDLKPENIMLGRFGEVYILDWGIAKVMHRADTPVAEPVDVPASPTATRAGATLGTPRYMAPERRSGVATPATDVFALGVMLADILECFADASPELEQIKDGATAFHTSARYRSARVLHDEIEKYLDGDRDLETRKKLAEQHALLAEQAFSRAHHSSAERSVASHEVGRALGLDPANARAVRTLMKLLTDVPESLPVAAQTEIDRRWRERRKRMLRVSTLSTLTMLLLVPMMMAMGIRDWTLMGCFAGLVAVAAVAHMAAISVHVPMVLLIAATSLLTTSASMFGVVPAAFAIVTMAWRMNVERALHGVIILITCACALAFPFVLAELGVIAPNYALRDGTLVILPRLHELPADRSLFWLITATIGAISVALLYGRLFINELRRAEHRLNFQAWQLQQLLPEVPARER